MIRFKAINDDAGNNIEIKESGNKKVICLIILQLYELECLYTTSIDLITQGSIDAFVMLNKILEEVSILASEFEDNNMLKSQPTVIIYNSYIQKEKRLNNLIRLVHRNLGMIFIQNYQLNKNKKYIDHIIYHISIVLKHLFILGC